MKNISRSSKAYLQKCPVFYAKNGTFLSDFYSILVMYLTDVQWLEKKKPRQRPPHLPPHQRRRRRHPLAHRNRLVLLHHQRLHPLRHPRHLPLPIRPPHPLSRRPHRKLLHGQQTGSRLPPLTRRQTRNNRNHHRRHRKVCAHLGRMIYGFSKMTVLR